MVYNSVCLWAYLEIGAPSLPYYYFIPFSSNKPTEQSHLILHTIQGSENVIYCLYCPGIDVSHVYIHIWERESCSAWYFSDKVVISVAWKHHIWEDTCRSSIRRVLKWKYYWPCSLCLQSTLEQMMIVAFGQECGFWVCNSLLSHNSPALRVWFTESQPF